jgi:large subunit ribosomal protein L29
MDIAEIRALTDVELDEALVDARRELWQLRFDLTTRQLNDYSKIRQARRRIARLLTVRGERQRQGTEA